MTELVTIQEQACPEVQVENPAPNVFRAGGALLPLGWIERLEQDQTLAHCCRHPENHKISAYYSNKIDKEWGLPDIYMMRCNCGKCHVQWCCSVPESAAVIVYAAPYLTSESAEATRPIWS